jgi:hypothetical protein
MCCCKRGFSHTERLDIVIRAAFNDAQTYVVTVCDTKGVERKRTKCEKVCEDGEWDLFSE